jgi:hypothetical protein
MLLTSKSLGLAWRFVHFFVNVIPFRFFNTTIPSHVVRFRSPFVSNDVGADERQPSNPPYCVY